MSNPRGIFVCGSPRTGTTVIGSYLGSSSSVADLGEFGGFFTAWYTVPVEFSRIGIGSYFKDEYLTQMQEHAREFVESVAVERNYPFYLDHFPGNTLIGRELALAMPDAVFVLMVRHPVPVIESMGRQFSDGHKWVPDTVSDRARLWCQIYSAALEIPEGQIVAVSYDNLITSPRATLDELEARIAALGFDLGPLDQHVLTVSHASRPAHNRPTMAQVEDDGIVQFKPREIFWDPAIESEVLPITRELQNELASRFNFETVRAS